MTYTILTQKPHPDIAGIHDRQPVAIALDDCEAWLDDQIKEDELRAVLARWSFDSYESWPISSRVGSVAHQDASLIEAI